VPSWRVLTSHPLARRLRSPRTTRAASSRWPSTQPRRASASLAAPGGPRSARPAAHRSVGYPLASLNGLIDVIHRSLPRAGGRPGPGPATGVVSPPAPDDHLHDLRVPSRRPHERPHGAPGCPARCQSVTGLSCAFPGGVSPARFGGGPGRVTPWSGRRHPRRRTSAAIVQQLHSGSPGGVAGRRGAR
jgi:hypothetical protein